MGVRGLRRARYSVPVAQITTQNRPSSVPATTSVSQCAQIDPGEIHGDGERNGGGDAAHDGTPGRSETPRATPPKKRLHIVACPLGKLNVFSVTRAGHRSGRARRNVIFISDSRANRRGYAANRSPALRRWFTARSPTVRAWRSQENGDEVARGSSVREELVRPGL